MDNRTALPAARRSERGFSADRAGRPRPRLPGRSTARPFARLLVAAVALAASANAAAIDYLVEVVLFENVGGAPDVDGALWFPKTGPAFALGGDEARAADFEVIETDLSLEENARSIAGSRNYRVLRHFAWRQPGLDARSARAIRVNVGPAFDLYLPDDIAPYDEFIPASADPRPDRGRAIRSTEVAGTLKVRLGRFLHLETLLVLTDEEEGRSYRLAESRKMRSRELHYIDNPRFGLLTRILPIEEPES